MIQTPANPPSLPVRFPSPEELAQDRRQNPDYWEDFDQARAESRAGLGSFGAEPESPSNAILSIFASVAEEYRRFL